MPVGGGFIIAAPVFSYCYSMFSFETPPIDQLGVMSTILMFVCVLLFG